jgi:hypothetical protein
MPSATSRVALASATRLGRRCTKRERRYQKPSRAPRASRSAARCIRFGASAFTRVPSSASTAGSTISATPQAMSATIMPPSPIEWRKFCGNTSSEAIATATVRELNSTDRPAVSTVRRSAWRPGPWTAISSRYRETMNRL